MHACRGDAGQNSLLRKKSYKRNSASVAALSLKCYKKVRRDPYLSYLRNRPSSFARNVKLFHTE